MQKKSLYFSKNAATPTRKQLGTQLIFVFGPAVYNLMRILCSIFLCFWFLFTNAQQIDSLRNILQQTHEPLQKCFALAKFSFALSSSNPDSAKLLAQQAIQLATNMRNDSAIAACYQSLGWCYYHLGKKDSSEYFLTKARVIYHQLKEANDEGTCLVNLGTVYNEYHEYSKSLNCLIAARPLLETTNNENMLAYLDRTLGVIYRQQGQYDESKKHFSAAMVTFKKLDNLAYLADTYTSYGSVLWYEGNYDSALYYYHNAYSIYKNTTKNIASQAYAAENIANAFYKKANEQDIHPWIDSTYYYYSIALNAFIKLGGEENIKYEQMLIGEVLRIMKQYKLAEDYLTDAFHYFDSTNDITSAFNAADGLSRLYKDIKDYKKAYEYTILEDKYKDSIDSRNRADSIAKMFAQYETEKKDRTIQLLNAQAKLDEKEISNQHIIEIFSLISVVLAGVLFLVLVNRNRIKQQLKEVKVRNQLAGDLHDEVGSSLSSILLLSKMASSNSTEVPIDKTMLEKIAGNTKEVIDKMSDIVWMMNPKYDEGENLREKLEQYVLRVKDIAPFQICLNIGPEIDRIKFPMEMRKNVFLIFKEAINNALKYSEATNVDISLRAIGKSLQLLINDNGKGFDKTTVINGNGLETMALRTKSCKGGFNVESFLNKGTQINVVMPLPHFR